MAKAIGVSSRAAIAAVLGVDGQAAYLWEDGREGLFVFSADNLSTQVAADPEQGLFIAPASVPSGASGRG